MNREFLEYHEIKKNLKNYYGLVKFLQTMLPEKYWLIY